jgi:subtilisin family serine protease
MRKSRIIPMFSVFLISLSACSWFQPRSAEHGLTKEVEGLEQPPETGRLTLPQPELPALPRGGSRLDLTPETHIPLQYSKTGKAYLPVEGLISDAGFARAHSNAALLKLPDSERSRRMQELLTGIVSKISRRAELHGTYYAPDVGYFSGWVSASDYAQLGSLTGLDTDILLAPRIQSHSNPHMARRSRSHARENGTENNSGNLSGIERMGVSRFLQMTETELGRTPTGESVRVGVTDTGITYGHPAFASTKSNKQRISYMKDFTSEGAGFVSSRAAMKITRESASGASKNSAAVSVSVDAQYLSPDAFESGIISQDENGKVLLPFNELLNERFVLPQELVKAFEASAQSVRLGALNESVFGNEDEKVDINANGRTDDVFYYFLVSGTDAKSTRVYLDFSGTKDFSSVKPLADFNASRKTVEVMSERIGISMTEVELPVTGGEGKVEKLVRVALVGFDPGNHGSHVSGIIGAQKYIANDSSETQARGVAPEADLMVNRVCSNNSGCNATRAIIDLAQNGAKIINMSLGGLSASNDGYGVQESIINRLTELYDVLFVISAGNSGPGRQTVGSPSTARHALSVAATATQSMISGQYNWTSRGLSDSSSTAGSDEDFVMFFSSRGPTAAGGFKPNISAPGTQLSSIQLNSASGSRAGMDVYWGTSMAAPAASGAVALLLDAAHMYNAKNPAQPMPTDALTLRRIILDSARPFNVNAYNPLSGAVSKGVYTWIDQGYGMVSLPQAWELLKKSAAVRLPTGVTLTESGGKTPVKAAKLDYKVRVLRSLGNGMKYDGNQVSPTGNSNSDGTPANERKFGQGVWLTEREAENLVEVHFNRSLNVKDLARPDVGDLLRQLNTTAETFALETVYYGSRTAWLKVGVPQSVSCNASDVQESQSLTIYGAGAVDAPGTGEAGPSLSPLRASALYLCLKKDLISELPAGDHGAIIRAFRIVNGQRDVTAAFEVPVYLTMPHHSASMQAKFSVSRRVSSFTVDRHYVRVPKGVSVLRVSLEVPKAAAGDRGQSCSGVSLMVLAGGNTRTPADLAMSGSVAQNCTTLGAPVNNRLSVRFTELKPLAGVWDLHVFGRYQFPDSDYTLNVDYATFEDVVPLALKPETLAAGEFSAVLRESTFDAAPDAAKSQFSLNALVGKTQHEISESNGTITIPDASGLQARRYRPETGTVTITTSASMEGLDIDMLIDECSDEQLKVCKTVARSGSANANERGVFVPSAGKFYAVRIEPYEIPADKAGFLSTEVINAQKPELGSMQVVRDGAVEGGFKMNYSFDRKSSQLLADPLYTSGVYLIEGVVKLANAAGISLIQVPVSVGR